jgi:hypothetical protein
MGALVVMASIMALHAKCHDRTVQLRQVAQRLRAIAESRKGCGVMAAAFRGVLRNRSPQQGGL